MDTRIIDPDDHHAGPRNRVRPDTCRPDIFAHFVVKTSRFTAMRDWYRNLLGADIVFDNGSLCFLTYDDEHHRLAISNIPGLREVDERSCGLSHLAYGYRTLRQLFSTYLRLKAISVLPYWTINHGPTVSMYYRDPDGAAIELQVDSFATKNEVAAYFHGDDFRANPIGVNFDPDDMIRRFEAGEPEENLKRRPSLPAGMTPDDMRPKRT